MRLSKFILLGCLVYSTTFQAANIYTPAALSQQLQLAELEQHITFVSSLEAQQLSSFTEQLIASDRYDAVVSERLLMTVLDSASQNRVSDMKPLLEQLSGYQSQIKVTIQDGGHQQTIVAFPVAGHARAILTDWRIDEQTNYLINAGKVDFSRVRSFLKSNNHSEADLVFSRLLSQTTKAEAQLLAQSIDKALLSDYQLMTLAEKNASIGLYTSLIERLNQPTSINPVFNSTLQTLPEIVGSEQAMDLLLQIETSSPYSSTAIHVLSGLPVNNDRIQNHLLNLLSDKRLGGDAAFALSSRLDITTINQLEQYLYAEDQNLQRRALLSLKLSQLPAARLVLDEFADNTSNLQLAREVME